MSFNRIQILGNLTRDPELRYTPQGTPVCTVNVASNDRLRDPKTKEYVDTPTFFRGTVFGRKAETISQHFEKGSEIFIEGKFRPEEWIDRDGQKRTTYGIQVADFNFTGGSNRQGSRANGAQAPQASSRANNAPASQPAAGQTESSDDDDIDFS